MVLARLEAEAAQARNSARGQAQREAAEAAALQAKELEAAQELETRAMERYVHARVLYVPVPTSVGGEKHETNPKTSQQV